MSKSTNKAAARPAGLEPYAGFAAVYDRIMAGVDYEGWADYIESLLKQFSRQPRSLLDLACGTGSSTLPFAARGYRVSGVDLSEAMLRVARGKAAAAGLPVDFYRMDLRALRLPERYDLALLFQDGLNYLLSERELLQAFSGICGLLLPRGLFIFDLTRPSLRNQSEELSVYWADEKDYTLIWESRYDRKAEIWELLLTVFMSEGEPHYRKFQERHREKDYSPETVSRLLQEAGFTLLKILPTYRLDPAGGSEPKLTFVARRLR